MDGNKQKEFEEACKPLMKFLAKECHPHMSVHVTSSSCELLSGEAVFNTEEFLID